MYEGIYKFCTWYIVFFQASITLFTINYYLKREKFVWGPDLPERREAVWSLIMISEALKKA